MKTMLLKIVSAAILLGIAYNVVSAQAGKSGPTLVGTWQTVVTPRNCSTGAPAPVTFPGILTFNQGGTMTGTSTAVSSVYGVWENKPGAHEYSFISISQRYSTAGVYVGTRRITQNVSIGDGGDTFTSEGTFQDTDAAGSPSASGCSTSVGTRLQ
jgi:hypothetical protein